MRKPSYEVSSAAKVVCAVDLHKTADRLRDKADRLDEKLADFLECLTTDELNQYVEQTNPKP